MMQTIGVVQVRPGSSGDSSYRRLIGGKSVLEWVVRRVTDCQQLDGVIVVAGDGADESDVAPLVPPDVPVFIGSQNDVLGRFQSALESFRAKAIVRVCADNPFVDPTLIDQLVTTAKTHGGRDYITYCSRNGLPAIQSPLGIYAEWFTAKALQKADQLATDPADRRDVTSYIRNHPEDFSMRLVALPEPIDRDDIRLQLDCNEDWELSQELFEAIGPEQLDWQGIADFLQHQPAIRRRMALLNQTVR